jgi:hypothetical protein
LLITLVANCSLPRCCDPPGGRRHRSAEKGRSGRTQQPAAMAEPPLMIKHATVRRLGRLDQACRHRAAAGRRTGCARCRSPNAGAAPLRKVLVDVYRELEFGWRPETLGSVTDLVPSLTMTDVEDAVVPAFGGAPDALG